MKIWTQTALASFALLLGSCSTMMAPEAPAGVSAYGLTSSGALAMFGTGNAAASYRTMPVTGLSAGDTLISIDCRNTDGRLYGVASTGRVYTINTSTGAATADGSTVGRGIVTVDFNPVANRLRVIGENNQNYRLTVNTAPVPSALPAGTLTEDGTFVYAPGDANAGKTPRLVASAYTNSFNDSAAGAAPTGATTALYSFDAAQGTLVLHDVGPQFSTLKTVAPLGVSVSAGMTGFDIVGADGAYATVSSGGNTNLYRVSLTAGMANALTLVSTLKGVSLRDLALVPGVR